MLKKLVPLAVLACLVSGCGDEATSAKEKDADSPSSSGDAGAYYFTAVREHSRAPVGNPGRPTTLEQALPCAADPAELSADVVVVGEISDVHPGSSYAYDYDSEKELPSESYTSDLADERDVIVEITAEGVMTAEGTEMPDDTVNLRIRIPEDIDPETFMESLESMGDVVGLLGSWKKGKHRGEFYPTMSGAGLGVIADDAMSFPGLGDTEEAFVANAPSASSLLEACPLP